MYASMNEQTRTPEAVNGLTSEQLREKLRKIKCFMLDMDGTFYLGNRILEGSLFPGCCGGYRSHRAVFDQ